MELRVNEVAIPEKIDFNYEELKAELTSKVSFYETLVYTDDQIKDAKADKANLNKLKRALNDERIRREKEYMQPFNVFKAQINEIIGIIDKPIAVIDEQVKAFDEKRKAEKQKAIEELFATIGFQNFVTLEKIWDPKWLNASVSMKSIEGGCTPFSHSVRTECPSKASSYICSARISVIFVIFSVYSASPSTSVALSRSHDVSMSCPYEYRSIREL